jgi:CheY-like chemotaxis protein
MMSGTKKFHRFRQQGIRHSNRITHLAVLVKEQIMEADLQKTTGDKAIQTNGKMLKLLLVDDEQTMHEMMALALKSTEYVLVSAMNVNQAMKEIASSSPPDIIITDAMMPGGSGFSLITSLKLNPATSDIPVILWTVMEQANGSVMDSSGKADIAMSKPFNLTHILDSLTRARQLIKADAAILF